MQSFWFWKNWSLDYRVSWFGLAGFFLISFFFLWYGYLMGPSNVIEWEVFQHQVTRESTNHTFEVGNFEFSVPIESYLTFGYFNGSPVHPNTIASYFFIFGLAICTLVLLCIITTLDRFLFFVGIGLFVLFMVTLRLEVIRLFGISGRVIPIIIIGIFVLVSFYFHTIRSSTPFLLRLLVFIGITSIIGLIVYFFAGVPYPFLHLATSGYLAAIVLSVVFILMIAHEIMASFVYVTSSGTSSSKSLRHFFIISVIYLINLVLTYMHEVRIIDWNFIFIDLYLLVSISAVLGIWGFKHREVLYENITPFYPFGAFLIISLATITFLTTGMLLGNHNDAALKIIRDVIIFSHLGYGVIFFVYIISNFIIMMAENLSAYKVLYRPSRMPYFTFRFAGLIATMAFIFYSNWHSYVYNGMSGFYNHLGDLYQLMDKKMLAEAYYQQGRSNGFQNNRSNYSLGLIESHKNEFKKAHFHYELANAKRPTTYSLANDGNLFIIEGRYFEGITSLAKAVSRFPESGVLQNNLGYAYSKIHRLDSALILFNNAQRHSVSKPLAQSNFIATIGNEYLPVKVDSLVNSYNSSSPYTLSNALAVATLQHQSFTYTFDPMSNPRLNMATAAQLNNFLAYSVKKLDTASINKARRIINDPSNAEYSESLKATLAQAYYHQNNVTQALATISELAFLSQIMQGKFNYIAGLWSLEQGSPELAISYFDYAVMFDYKEAKLYNAIALAEARYLPQALLATDSLLVHKDETIQEIGRQLRKIITVPFADLNTLNDLEKYQFCRYRIGNGDTLLFNRVISSFQSNDYKVSALLEMSQRQFDLSNASAAMQYMNQIKRIPISDKKLVEKVQHFELLLLASRGDLKTLTSRLQSGITFSRKQELEKALYDALMSEAAGDTITAEKKYAILADYNPFFEEGIITAARYFKKHSANDMRAYSILAEAIHVNTTSHRLWMAYRQEALNVGFDNQAADAAEQAEELKRRK